MKNWTVAEAVATINAGTDVEGIKEITTHFPIFALAAARGDLAAVAAMMPEKMTLRRLNQAAVEDVDTDVDDDDTEAEAPKAKAGKAAKSEPAEDDGDYSSMTKDQLIALCVEKGLKVAKHQKPKQYYIDALNAAEDEDDGEEEAPKKTAGKAGSKKVKAEEPDDDEDDAEDDEYAGKSAKELFNMCKERKIKVQPRQASRVYIEALKAADAEAEEAEDDGDDEGWGDEEAEEAPKAKSAGKSSKKAAAKKEDDDEEDWDI